MLKIFRYVSVFLVTACLLFACHAWTTTEVKRPILKIQLGYFVGEYPAIIAQEKGFFKAQGVDVELIHKTSSKLVQANFSAGKYDGVIFSLGSLII